MYMLAAEVTQQGLLKAGVKLPEKNVTQIVKWFAEFTRETVESQQAELSIEAGAEVKGGIPLLGAIFGNFKSKLAAGSERHLKVRENLRQSPEQLIDMVNQLIDVANQALLDRALATKGLLLLFDDLDRYPHESVSRLLTQGPTLMKRLKCHTVYTIPVDLRPLSGNVYSDNFDCPVVLPIPALRKQSDAWQSSVEESNHNEEAVNVMRTLLGKRLDIEALFENSDDATRLVKMSGGCVRDLMHLVNDARKRSDSVSSGVNITQISTVGASRSILDQRRNRCEGILEADYKQLVSIARRDPEAQQMNAKVIEYLGKRWVFQYNQDGPWLDVHPLLIETAGFQRAVQALDNAGGSSP